LGKIFLLLSLFVALPLYASEESLDARAAFLRPILDHAKRVVREKEEKGLPFVAIAGPSSVGKSYFTVLLARLLKEEGVSVGILKGDDFLDPDHNDPDHFHPALVYAVAHTVIHKIKQGDKVVRKPAWSPRDVKPAHKIEEDFVCEGLELILFEGEFTCNDDAPYDFRRYAEFGIFIDADHDDILQWNWDRREERPKVETTFAEFKKNNKPCLERYSEYVAGARDAAEYLIVKNSSHSYALRAKK
jgi:uridine kinase